MIDFIFSIYAYYIDNALWVSLIAAAIGSLITYLLYFRNPRN